ncbi:MAG TPA: VOC family protein [Candidatus Onthovivens sp.]|nr:VOC family protein [Candidatus Onthovivens sp.]
MIRKIDHVVITTKNIEKCVYFYHLLGFKVQNTDFGYALFAGDFKINVHQLGKELEPHALNVTLGSNDLCFEIDDNLEEFKEDLIKKGVIIEEGIVKRNGVFGPMNSIYVRDYDGNLIEFCNYK